MTRGKVILIVLSFAGWWIIHSVRQQNRVSDQEYARQVLDHYLKYVCPRFNVCDQPDALARMKQNWPKTYQLGFQVLDE